jgi:hypothetical protein
MSDQLRLIEYSCPRCARRRTIPVRFRMPTRVVCPHCAKVAGSSSVDVAGMLRERQVGVQEGLL